MHPRSHRMGSSSSHDPCFIYATVEDLFATCDMGTCDVTVKSVNKMVDA
jgi:hypothetical protein